MNATTTERKPLTEIQAKVLAYLVKCVELEDRIPPNHVIAKDFGWASPTAANEHVHAIERKGWLTRTHYGALMLADRPAMAPVFMGVDLAKGRDTTVFWVPRKEVAHG